MVKTQLFSMIKVLKSHWLIIIILILATFFRVYRISDYMEFLGDQGRDVVIAADFLKHGNLFFIGPQTSIGNMYLGPYYYYFFVVPGLLLANFNPVGPSLVVAFFGILTVYLIYLVSKEWFNPKVAYIASFLYAISPVVIKYSNFSWNPNVMPFFALLFSYFIYHRRLVLATIAFIFAINSHYLALLLLPPAFFYLAYHYYQNPKSRSSLLRNLGLSVIVFILSLTPLILFDLKHQGQNSKALLTFFTNRETTVNLKAYKALPIFPSLFNQTTTRLLAGKNINVGIYVSVFFCLIYLFAIYKNISKANPKFIYISLYYLIGLVGLALYKQHIYDHYFAFLFPFVFILFAHLLDYLGKYLYIPVIFILATLSLLENPFRYSPPKQLETTNQIITSIIASSGSQEFNFALLAKMNYDPGYRYFLDLYNSPTRLLQNKITDQLFVVCEPFQIECNPINHPEWNIAAFGWAKIDKQWEINGIKVFRLIHL